MGWLGASRDGRRVAVGTRAPQSGPDLPSVPPCTPGWGLGDHPCPSPVGDTMACGTTWGQGTFGVTHLPGPIPGHERLGQAGGKGPVWRIWGHERGRGRGSEVQPRRLSPGSHRTPMGLRGAGKQLTRRITAFHKSYFSSGLNSLPCAGGRAGPKGGHGRTPVPGTGSGRGAQHQRPRAVTPSGTRHSHAWPGSTGGLGHGG